MKTIILFILLAIGVQAQNIPVVQKTVNFYADSVANVSLERNLFLSGIYMPSGKTSSLKFEVSPDGTTYYRLSDDGSDYSISVDNTKNVYIPLSPTKFYGAKELKILISADVSDTLSIIVDLRSY